MSQERYGIRRFALLNTAGYSLGLFPLEHPLSVYGANNLGKSRRSTPCSSRSWHACQT